MKQLIIRWIIALLIIIVGTLISYKFMLMNVEDSTQYLLGYLFGGLCDAVLKFDVDRK